MTSKITNRLTDEEIERVVNAVLEKVNPKDLSVSKPFISYYADGYKGYDIFQYIFDLDNYKK